VELTLLRQELAVCRLDPDSELPEWARKGPLFSLTRTPDEWSVVCSQEDVPEGIRCEGGWRALRLHGPIDFSAVGILASLAAPLARSGISLFALSTFDTDYLLVKQADVKKASLALREEGHRIHSEPRPRTP
jgi:uncharacterized protein